MMPELHEYQKKALEFMLNHERSYLALDMGLGKTAITLKWIRTILPEVGAVLVIAPLRTIYSTWPKEIELWTPELSYSIVHGPNKPDALAKEVDIYLINFEGILWLFDQLKAIYKVSKRVPFRGLVIDEGSMVKRASTKRFKTLKKLIDIFPKYRTILSGTPAPNSLLDLWSQYYILDNGWRLGKFMSHYKQNYFYQVDFKGFVWALKKGAKEQIYNLISDITYRLDSKDYLNIPERIDNIIEVTLPKKAQKQYKTLEYEFFLELDKETNIQAFSAPALAMKLRQLVQGGLYLKHEPEQGPRPFVEVHNAKLEALKSIVEVANGQGILCAVQFRFEIDMIHKLFPEAPVIASGTSSIKAARYIQEWNKGNIPLLLCHPASISHGINLQAGSHIIVWYALTWNLEQYQQFNARLHRQGQKKGVIVHHIICKGTIDERIMKALKGKIKKQQQLLDFLKEAS